MNKELVFRKAERQQVKLRISLSGPSGSGKTYSALKLARGLVDKWEEIVLIDTENHRGDLYSDLGGYNILTLEAPFAPERFIEAIHLCEENGVKVIIIDSSSHEWGGLGGCLDANQKLADAKFKGNTWAAWSITGERHHTFIDAIIASPCHVITTMRSKTETIMTDDKKVKKVGMKEIQREGFEYEMTIAFDLDRERHLATAGKDNTHIFENRDPFVISEKDGEDIKAWNAGGIDPEEVRKREEKKERFALTGVFKEQLKELKMTKAAWEKAVKSKWEDLSLEEATKWIKKNEFKINSLKEPKESTDEEEAEFQKGGGAHGE